MATKISNILVRVIVFFAVLGIIFLLTMYNVKLLHTLNWFKTSNKMFDLIIIVIASISYSLGSIAVVIWYNPIKQNTESKLIFNIRYTASILLKSLFVLIDGVHVYVYNNTHINDLATWLSPVYALQTALILFFVGSIVNDIIKNGKEKEDNNKGKFMVLESELELRGIKIKELKTHIQDFEDDIADKKTIIDNSKTKLVKLETNIDELKTAETGLMNLLKTKEDQIDKYYPLYLKLRVSSIRKKNEDNRSEEELAILQEYEQLDN